MSEQKLADIRKLLELMNSAELGKSVFVSVIQNFRQMYDDVPSEFWDEVEKEVNYDRLIELIIPVYDKNLSHEVIKSAIEFYETKNGQELVKALPQISQESMAVGNTWGMELGQLVVEKLSLYQGDDDGDDDEDDD
eukprot:Anaeramoba_ignava/a607781_366.p1 GENE.a607781_366~~a607781_366.p1  ORF type:complete len:144 (+),score=44.32 a607781_366:26-433(+)